MSLIFKLREFLPDWTCFYLGLLRYALATGAVKTKEFKDLQERRASLLLVDDSGDAVAEAAAQGLRAGAQAAQARLRAVCKSNLQLSIFLLSDPEVKWRMKVIKHCGAPLAKWHSHCSETCRSASGNQELRRPRTAVSELRVC